MCAFFGLLGYGWVGLLWHRGIRVRGRSLGGSGLGSGLVAVGLLCAVRSKSALVGLHGCMAVGCSGRANTSLRSAAQCPRWFALVSSCWPGRCGSGRCVPSADRWVDGQLVERGQACGDVVDHGARGAHGAGARERQDLQVHAGGANWVSGTSAPSSDFEASADSGGLGGHAGGLDLTGLDVFWLGP